MTRSRIFTAPVRRRAQRLSCAIVIPAFRAAKTIRRVVELAREVADYVIVVDDACPERSSELVEAGDRVHVVCRERNGGVGAAVKTGIERAIALGADVVIKIDSDDQMDVGYVPKMRRILETLADIDMVKGNRFAHRSTLTRMPRLRLIGNAILTLLVKISSGYWTLVDPTNGFVALRVAALHDLRWQELADRYFFEIDLLCEFGIDRRNIVELEMPAIYRGEESSLSISRVALSFPPRLLARFARRMLINYLLAEINVGSLCTLFGFPLLLCAVLFGGYQWYLAAASGIMRPTGTIILALLLFMVGFQLVLQAIMYDVQFAPRTQKMRGD